MFPFFPSDLLPSSIASNANLNFYVQLCIISSGLSIVQCVSDPFSSTDGAEEKQWDQLSVGDSQGELKRFHHSEKASFQHHGELHGTAA